MELIALLVGLGLAGLFAIGCVIGPRDVSVSSETRTAARSELERKNLFDSLEDQETEALCWGEDHPQYWLRH